MRLTPLALTLCLAAPALAETPMTASEFEAYSTGKTLSFAMGDVIWGAEQYLPGRRVIWAYSEDECQYGHWFEDQGQICFVYDTNPEPQCWHFFNEGSGLRAEFLAEGAATSLSEVDQSPEPLFCPGPDVGA